MIPHGLTAKNNNAIEQRFSIRDDFAPTGNMSGGQGAISSCHSLLAGKWGVGFASGI